MIFLLDTNILSEMVKLKLAKVVMANIERRRHSLVTAAPVWHELVFGFTRMPASPRKDAIEVFLYDVVRKTLPLLPYDEMAASWHAAERARLVSSGLTPSFVDGQIASIACTNQCVLVTRNTRDYEHFSGLALENWFI